MLPILLQKSSGKNDQHTLKIFVKKVELLIKGKIFNIFIRIFYQINFAERWVWIKICCLLGYPVSICWTFRIGDRMREKKDKTWFILFFYRKPYNKILLILLVLQILQKDMKRTILSLFSSVRRLYSL